MIRKGLLYSLPFLIAIIGVSIYGWFATEPGAQLPVHWGLNGEADGYAGRTLALSYLPLTVLVMAVIFAVLPLIDPRGRNLQRSRPAYLAAWVGIMALMTVVQAVIVLSATGIMAMAGTGLAARMIAGGVGLLFIVIGNVLGKARPNWFFGVRTPWTLSSDLSWDKTHRLTGRMMVLGGLASLLAAIVLPLELAFAVLIAGSLVPAVVGVVYSFFVWRSDPDREVATPEDAD
jgi:uncharacterized membrane protein